VPVLEKESPDVMMFQHTGTPTHFYKKMTELLNRIFLEK
jgi:hypothetical protein